MSAAIERIVVQTTPDEKQAIVEKARQLNISVSELMRSGASAYTPSDGELESLAEAVQASAERSMAVMDETLAKIAASNSRIEAMEKQAAIDRQLTATTQSGPGRTP